MSITSATSTLPMFVSQSDIKNLQMKELDTEIGNNHERTQSENYGTFLDCDVVARIGGEEKIAELTSQEKINTMHLARQKKMLTQVNEIQKIASSLRTLVVAVGQSCKSQQAFVDQVQGFLDQIEGIMNSEHHGDQTLAGKELKEKSVDIKSLPRIEPGHGIDYSYYKGEDGNQSIKVNDDTQVDLYPITGKHDAFAKIIQAARLLLTIDPTDTKCAGFKEAKKLGKEALEHDLPDATYRIEIETEKLDDAIKKVPRLIILESERIRNANTIDQMTAINHSKTLEHTRDIAINTMSKTSILNHRLTEEIFRAMSAQ